MSVVPDNIQNKHDIENTVYYLTWHQDLLYNQSAKLKCHWHSNENGYSWSYVWEI
jgi:hypothetical protein